MSKKTKKASPQVQVRFHTGSHDLYRCGFCGLPRIESYNDSRIVVLHVLTAKEFNAAVEREAAQKALDLKNPRDRAFAEREVGWEKGQVRQETLNLCSQCFAKVRVCFYCDYYSANHCHVNHETFSIGKAIPACKEHFCGDWDQAEPFAEEDVLELLTKDMP
jgi:hypothetical protein